MTDASALDLDEEELKALEDIRQLKSELLSSIEYIKKEIQDADDTIEQLEDMDRYKESNYIKKLTAGKKYFNENPKKGMAWLIECDVVINKPWNVADFLFKNNEKGLSKTAIGNYLGENNEFNIEVLKQFVEHHNFANEKLDDALRIFLWNFRLPGEAQIISRIMESFAAWFVNSNPGIFSCADTCFILSFSVIMLNTSLHNPNINPKNRTSKEAFINMNQKIDEGKNLSSVMLTNIYDSIKKRPFKVPEDDKNLFHFSDPDIQGWLFKQGSSRYKTWKRRWFVLDEQYLFYFEYTKDKEPKGVISLENLQVREVSDPKKQNCFEIFLPANTISDTIKISKSDPEGKIFEGAKHSSYRFSAPCSESKREWILNIRKSISKDPYYDMITARKKSHQDHQK